MGRDEVPLEGYTQFCVNVEKEEWKLDTLLDLCNSVSTQFIIIFANTRSKVCAELCPSQRCMHARVQRCMQARHFNCGSIIV